MSASPKLSSFVSGFSRLPVENSDTVDSPYFPTLQPEHREDIALTTAPGVTQLDFSAVRWSRKEFVGPLSPFTETFSIDVQSNTIAQPNSALSDELIGTTRAPMITGPITEPNDSLTQATQTLLGPNNPGAVSFSGYIGDNPNFAPGRDVDIFVVRMNAGDRLTLDIDAEEFGSFLDSGLRLFDASGNELALSDDNAAPGEEDFYLDSYLDFVATETGNYYIGVSGYGNLDYDPFAPGSGKGGSTGDYELTMSLSGHSEETNDTLTTAILTGLTENTPGTVNYTGAIGDNPNVRPGYDVDVYAVQLGEGDTLIADLDSLAGSYLDSVFRLFDSEGNEVAFSDDDADFDEDFGYDSFLSFTATAAGNYFLSVSGHGNSDYDPFFEGSGSPGSTGDYTLSLAIASTLGGDLAGDSISEAYDTGVSSANPDPFTLTTVIGDNPAFSPGLDVDFFSFQINQGDLVTIDIDLGFDLDDLGDSVLILFDEFGNELFYSDDGAAPGEPYTFESYISFIAPETGTYYVGVSGYGNDWYDPFTPGSGYEAYNTGEYSIEIAITNAPEGDFSTIYGYGMVDASVAVAAAVGALPFEDVDDLGGDLWGLDLVNAPAAWAQGYTGEGTIVAVLDTGVDYTHIDLAGNIWSNPGEVADNGMDDDGNGFVDDVMGWNFIDDTNDPADWYGHGTHVSGTIAGLNNGFGITGVAYDTLIMPVSVIGDYSIQDDYEYLRDIASGIYYAVDNGADVINMSLGYYPEWFYDGWPIEADEVVNAIAYAHEQGTVVVMAAGNDYGTEPGYPAIYSTDWGISVGAVDSFGQMTYFSNYAGFTELSYVVAPGDFVYSTVPGDGYDYYSGTSMASPHVAGVAALMMGANPDLTAEEVIALLTETANPDEVTV